MRRREDLGGNEGGEMHQNILSLFSIKKLQIKNVNCLLGI